MGDDGQRPEQEDRQEQEGQVGCACDEHLGKQKVRVTHRGRLSSYSKWMSSVRVANIQASKKCVGRTWGVKGNKGGVWHSGQR
jgi:hypothetical protein